jgi:hypothetical protein
MCIIAFVFGRLRFALAAAEVAAHAAAATAVATRDDAAEDRQRLKKIASTFQT